MRYKFSDQAYSKLQDRAQTFAFISMMVTWLVKDLDDYSIHSLVLAAVTLMVLGYIEWGKDGESAGAILTLSNQGLHYQNSSTGRELLKRYDQIAQLKHQVFWGCPVLTITFRGDEQLSLVSLEDSEIAFRKLRARAGLST